MDRSFKLYEAFTKAIQESGCGDDDVIIAISTLLRSAVLVLDDRARGHLLRQMEDVVAGCVACEVRERTVS